MTYMYSSSCGTKTIAIEESDFEDIDWHFRLILEGEDRLSHNEDNRSYYRVILYEGYFDEPENRTERIDEYSNYREYFLEQLNEILDLLIETVLTFSIYRFIIIVFRLKGMPITTALTLKNLLSLIPWIRI